MPTKCPTCGAIIESKEVSLPSWASSARSKFGKSVEIAYCPTCDESGTSPAKLKGYYEEFVQGKVDFDGNPRPLPNPLPPKIRTMTFASFQVNPSLRDAYQAAVKYAQMYPTSGHDGKGLLLYGPVGTGKTHLAAAISNALVERGYDVLWANVPQFITKLKRSFDTGVNEATVMEVHIRAGLLILDDIGSEKPTEWVESRIYEVINSRIERHAPIIFTSNCPTAALLERLGERVVSRIRGISQAFQLNVPDYRSQQRP